ncbi:MAG: GNAT family N-acetyltransferase [Roseivirga sp.]
MAGTIEIRRCELDDLEALTAIGLQTFTDTFAHLNDPKYFEPYLAKAFSKAQIKSELEHASTEFYFLYYDQKLAGYLKLNFAEAQSDLKDPESLEIERIYITDTFQGLGLGKTLFELSLKKAQSHSLKYIWLGVWEKNTKAIGFYESRGFYKFANHPFKLGDDLQTDYLMRLDL